MPNVGRGLDIIGHPFTLGSVKTSLYELPIPNIKIQRIYQFNIIQNVIIEKLHEVKVKHFSSF